MVAALVPIGPRQFQTDACSLLKFGPLSHIQPKRWQGHCGPIALCFVTFLASRKLRQIHRRNAWRGSEGVAATSAVFDLLDVPINSSQQVKLKRFLDKDGLAKSLERALPSPPPILLLHDGPGLPSKYLEPLAPRLCSPNGRSCYTYDQRGCGLSQGEGSADLGTAVLDLLAVLRFLHCSLGEAELHILAHGFGGALLMEALARHDLFSSPGLPKLRSFCLWSVASSTQLADQAAEELMAASAQSVGQADAARAFWFRLMAYQQSGFSPRWGALRGWDWKSQRWELRPEGALDGWSVCRQEVVACFRGAKPPRVPVLSLRGQHDFVTEACVAAWRGVEDAGGDFSESVLGGCGHHAHLEAPDTVAATLRLWLLKVEDGPATSSRTPSSTSWTPSSGVKGRWLLREEARQHLTSWASKLCWANALASNATPGAWRSVGQGLPQRDIFAPSRTARRLAVWAADLPERPKSSADAEVMSLSELWKNRPRCSRMALALQDDSFDAAAIVCLERTNGDVTIVGMAQNPSAPHRCEGVLEHIEETVQSSK
ncbi:unnamed protein product [Durusdinium trenchii]|uniref:AB hydrolase-1 domain-containing protein n=3 Tax=Durusdinium trenchii TaxID=1381693 RepID=A0ABP0S795_9DINO